MTCTHYPFAKGLTRDFHAISGKDFSESMKWEVVRVFSNEDFGEKTFVGKTPGEQAFRKFCNFDTTHAFRRKCIFGADGLFDIEAPWLVCQLLGYFFTNFNHLPVDYTTDPFEALELQDDLQVKYTGGTVLHLFAGEKIADPSSIKLLVKRICSQYKLPYFTLTPTFSICPQHGYQKGEQPHCPQCHTTCEVYSRIVGYLRPVEQWNEGKKEEFAMRKPFTFGKTL